MIYAPSIKRLSLWSSTYVWNKIHDKNMTIWTDPFDLVWSDKCARTYPLLDSFWF